MSGYIKKIEDIIILLSGVSLTVVSIYTAYFGTLDMMYQNTLHLTLISIIALYKYPLKIFNNRSSLNFYLNTILSVLIIIGNAYMALYWEELYITPFMTNLGILVGALTVIVLLEITRRTVGISLVLITLAFIAYTFWGDCVHGFLCHRGYDLERLLVQVYAGTEGIYGIPLGTCATIVIIFIIFGSFLDVAGAANVFLDLSMALMGKRRGGPAKIAIFSSGLMGMLSGSPAANVATTGTVTIPMMKQTGFPPYVAAAIEATASSGGYKTPPIMGAAAFIMAQALGVSYFEICIAATLPAFFHYFGLYAMVDLFSGLMGFSGKKKEELPEILKVLKSGAFLILPIIILIVLLVLKFTAMYACAYSLLSLWFISLLMKKLTFKNVIFALRESAERMVMVSIPCATAGIIMGILTLTGIGMKLSDIIQYIASGSLFLTLVCVMVISIILGMGLPPVVSYLVLAALEAPALVSMGVNPIAAHLFIFYYCCLSLLTPPICTTAFTAAAIAKSPPMKTGFESVRFGIVLFTLPFLFVYNSGLLMEGSLAQIVYASVIAGFGVYALAVGAQGFLFRKIGLLKRAIYITASILLFFPSYTLTVVGGVIFAVLLLFDKYAGGKNPVNFKELNA